MSEVKRPCVGCGNTDDHPRHVIGLSMDTHDDVYWHVDCHANNGCTVCKGVLEGMKPGLTGDDMRAHLTKEF
jgi:hypothetical protein